MSVPRVLELYFLPACLLNATLPEPLPARMFVQYTVQVPPALLVDGDPLEPFDEEQHVGSLSIALPDGERLTVARLKEHWPFEGPFHFRARITPATEPENFVWMDLINDAAFVPLAEGVATIKALPLFDLPNPNAQSTSNCDFTWTPAQYSAWVLKRSAQQGDEPFSLVKYPMDGASSSSSALASASSFFGSLFGGASSGAGAAPSTPQPSTPQPSGPGGAGTSSPSTRQQGGAADGGGGEFWGNGGAGNARARAGSSSNTYRAGAPSSSRDDHGIDDDRTAHGDGDDGYQDQRDHEDGGRADYSDSGSPHQRYQQNDGDNGDGTPYDVDADDLRPYPSGPAAGIAVAAGSPEDAVAAAAAAAAAAAEKARETLSAAGSVFRGFLSKAAKGLEKAANSAASKLEAAQAGMERRIAVAAGAVDVQDQAAPTAVAGATAAGGGRRSSTDAAANQPQGRGGHQQGQVDPFA